MGVARNFGEAFSKAELAAGDPLPQSGTILVSINRQSKDALLPDMQLLHEGGFKLVATEGTYRYLNENGIPCSMVHKVSEGRPNIIDLVKNGEVNLIINTPTGKVPKDDDNTIRVVAVRYRVPIITTVAAAKAAVLGMRHMQTTEMEVRSIQEYHAEVN